MDTFIGAIFWGAVISVCLFPILLLAGAFDEDELHIRISLTGSCDEDEDEDEDA